MKKVLSILVFITCCLSCEHDKKTKIAINNRTNLVIDSLKIIYGTEKEYREYVAKSIIPNELVNTELDMNLKGEDGGYSLEVFQGEKTTTKYFGYYSNALFKNYTYNLNFERDTLIISKYLMK